MAKIERLPQLGDIVGSVTQQQLLDHVCKGTDITNANTRKLNEIIDSLQNQPSVNEVYNGNLASATGDTNVYPTGWVTDTSLTPSTTNKNPSWKLTGIGTATLYQYIYPTNNECSFFVQIGGVLLTHASYAGQIDLILSREEFETPLWVEKESQTVTKSQIANFGSHTEVKLDIGSKTNTAVSLTNQRFKITIKLKNAALDYVDGKENKEKLGVHLNRENIIHFATTAGNATTIGGMGWLKPEDLLLRTDENEIYTHNTGAWVPLNAVADGGNADTVDSQHATDLNTTAQGYVNTHAALDVAVGVHPNAKTHIDATAPHSGHELTANKDVVGGYQGIRTYDHRYYKFLSDIPDTFRRIITGAGQIDVTSLGWGRYQTGAVSGNTAITDEYNIGTINTSKNPIIEATIKISSLTYISVAFGYRDLITGIPNNYIGIKYAENTGTPGNWVTQCKKDGYATDITTGVAAVAETEIKLKIVATTTSVKFYINDVLVETTTTNIPTTDMQIELYVKTNTSASRYLEVKDVYFQQDL